MTVENGVEESPSLNGDAATNYSNNSNNNLPNNKKPLAGLTGNGSAHNRGLGGGSNHSRRGLRKSKGTTAEQQAGAPTESLASDESAHHHSLGGGIIPDESAHSQMGSAGGSSTRVSRRDRIKVGGSDAAAACSDDVAARPGAVSVTEPSVAIGRSSTHGATTAGVGGAPQGNIMLRSQTAPAARPGAVSVVEPSSSAPCEPGASAGVGGAPQGKLRQRLTSTSTAAIKPGAVSVVEDSAPTEPGASTGVGGAPQGKGRRSTARAVAAPGAFSVVEPSTAVSEPGAATGVGGAPQGKFRRSTARAAARPGAVSVVEPSAAAPEPRATTGLGGAPQGKFRRTATAPAVSPGAVSMVEPSLTEPGAATGVGGAPQGKFRRTATAPALVPGAVGSVAPTRSEPGGGSIDRSSHHGAKIGALGMVRSSMQEPSVAPAGSTRHLLAVASEPRTLVPAVSVRSLQASENSSASSAIVSSIEGDVLAKSNVRRSRPVTVVPGAQSGVSTSTAGDMPGGDSDAVISSIERDMLAKSNARGSRRTVSAMIPGVQSIVSEPGQDALDVVNSAERDLLTKSRSRVSVGLSSRGLVGNAATSSRGLVGNAAPSSRGLGGNAAPSTRGLGGNAAPSNRGLVPTTRGLSNRNFNARGSAHGSAHSGESDFTQEQLDRHAQATAGLLGGKSPSQSSFASDGSYDPENPAEQIGDFDTAIQLVDDDIEAKMRARASAGNRPAVPGAMPAEAVEPDFYPDPVDDETEKEKITISAQSAESVPATTQDRMELKIMQFEREQASRDDKLEELEEHNLRRVGPARHKVTPSPHSRPDTFDDVSGPIDDGLLNPDPEAVRQAEEDGLAIAVAVEEEEPDVYDVELKMYDPEAKPPFFKNRRFRCYSALIFCLVMGAIITAIVVVLTKNGGETFLRKHATYATHAPSQAPSQAPTTTRETAVRDELARVIGDIVNEPGTVFEAALDWIINDDKMELDEFSENLIQRYTLALFYHQTSQERNWTSCNPPVGEEDYYCEFFEHGRNKTDNSQFYTLRDDLEVRWLSERHECEWAEVQCHPEADGNVIAIDILGQNLTGTLPVELKHLERLMWLTLSYNFMSGSIPEVYGDFPYLTIFEITENLITGQIPAGFFTQPNLLQLNPAGNMITGTIPSEVGQLTTLHSLFFFNTLIEGTLPTEMGLLEDIRNLWLYDNNLLSGPLPSELGELSLLEELKLSNNGHSGFLPSELGLLQNVKEFLFAGNNMGGSVIPEEFWNISSMAAIDFNGAGFGGTLSTNIGKMTDLYGFKASRNSFTGLVPTELGSLDSLLLLWIQFNDLTGSVPNEICQLRGPDNLQFLNADCAGFDAQITCTTGCCTGCCDEFGQCQVQ